MKTIAVKILFNGSLEQAELIEDRHSLVFKFHDIYIKREEAGRSSYSLLSEIRKNLEYYNILILCNGSRYDVYARGMHHAYVMRLGQVTTWADIVNIFDPVDETDIDKIKTVAEQDEYIQRWRDSLRTLSNK